MATMQALADHAGEEDAASLKSEDHLTSAIAGVDEGVKKLSFRAPSFSSTSPGHQQLFSQTHATGNAKVHLGNIHNSYVISGDAATTAVRSLLDMDKTKTALFMIPHPQNPDFVGRTYLVDEIKEKMAFKPNVQARVGLYGLGGIGKSQVATAFAYAVKKELEHAGISLFWVHAANHARFEQSYMEIAAKAGIILPCDPASDKLQVITAWLSDERNGKWQMIIDNADDFEIFRARTNANSSDQKIRETGLSRYLPRCSHGSILFTSRDRNACIQLAGPKSIVETPCLDLESCKALLAEHIDTSEDDEAANALIALLDYLPLALAQAAGFMTTNDETLPNYLKLYTASEAERVELLGEEFQPPGRDDVPNSVSVTWIISFERIKSSNKLAADLLSFMAFIDMQGIPDDLLPRWNATSVQYRKAIGCLQGFMMLIPSPDKKLYSIHRLVHLATRIWIEKENEKDRWTGEALSALSEAFPEVEFENWPLCARYLPHAQSALQHARGKMLNLEKRLKLLRRIADYTFNAIGQVELSKTTISEAVTLSAALKETHPERIRIMSNMCAIDSLYEWKIDAGRLEELVTIQEHQLRLAEEFLGLEDEATLEALSVLSYLYSDQKRYEEAESNQRRFLDATKLKKGERHADTLKASLGLAAYLTKKDRMDEALDIHTQNLKTARDILGEGHPDVANQLLHIAYAYGLNEQWDLCESHIRESLDICQQVLGMEHPIVILRTNSLVTILWQQGNLPEAAVMASENLAVSKRTLGYSHSLTLEVMESVAYLFLVQNKPDMAVKIYQEKLDILLEIASHDSPHVIECMKVLAQFYRVADQLDEASELYKTIMSLQKKPDKYLLHNLKKLAKRYDKLRQFKREEIILTHAMSYCRQTYSEEDQEVVGIKLDLAACLYRQSDFLGCDALEVDILATRERALGLDDVRTGIVMVSLAATRQRLRKYTESMDLLENCYDLSRRTSAIDPSGSASLVNEISTTAGTLFSAMYGKIGTIDNLESIPIFKRMSKLFIKICSPRKKDDGLEIRVCVLAMGLQDFAFKLYDERKLVNAIELMRDISRLLHTGLGSDNDWTVSMQSRLQRWAAEQDNKLGSSVPAAELIFWWCRPSRSGLLNDCEGALNLYKGGRKRQGDYLTSDTLKCVTKVVDRLDIRDDVIYNLWLGRWCIELAIYSTAFYEAGQTEKATALMGMTYQLANMLWGPDDSDVKLMLKHLKDWKAALLGGVVDDSDITDTTVSGKHTKDAAQEIRPVVEPASYKFTIPSRLRVLWTDEE